MTLEESDKKLPETTPDFEDKVVIAKRICLALQSQDRKVRKNCFIEFQTFLSDRQHEFSEADLSQMFSETYMYFFNGLRDKTETVREQAIKFVKFFIVQTLPLNDYYLAYTFPVIIERIGTVEFIEESEEIRLQLVELLESIIDRYSEQLMFSQFLQDCVTILSQTVTDKHPMVKELSCKTIVKLAKALPKHFHMQAENLIKPTLTCFRHQRYKVRVESIIAIGEIVMHSTYKGIDEVIVPLAEKLFDQIPSVRQTIARVAARWLMEHRDRYSFWYKMLPLLLTGLNDEVVETRMEAYALWEKVGLQYQQENEKDLKDQLDYLLKPPKYYPDNWVRPNLGCRTLVQRNASKIAAALSRELMSWQEDIRLRCSQLLCAIAVHTEEGLTFNLQDLLPSMYSAARDDDKRVVDNIIKASEIIGFFVRFDTWSQLVLPVIEDGPHFGHMTVLAGLVQGTPKEYISGNVEQISKLLADDFICCNRKKKYQLELLKCVKTLMEKYDSSMQQETTTGYNLFKIILTLIALKDPENASILTASVLEDLSKTLGLDSKKEVLAKYTGQLLKHVHTTPSTWTIVSDQACIFLTLLAESEEAFGLNLDEISDILCEVLDSETDAELRLKTFFVLSSVFEKKDVVCKDADDLTGFLERIITDIFVPSLVWHAGATAEAIRTMAATCLQYALTPSENQVDLFSTGESLRPLVDKLLPLLLSLVEDASYRSRQVAIECLTLLKGHCCKKEVWSNEDLIKIYPEMLKRLDDPTEKVRISTLKNLPVIFENVPEEFVMVNYKGHHELIVDTLLTHFDDDEDDIRKMVFDILKVVAKINKSTFMDKMERHRSLLRNQNGCDELISFVQTLA